MSSSANNIFDNSQTFTTSYSQYAHVYRRTEISFQQLVKCLVIVTMCLWLAFGTDVNQVANTYAATIASASIANQQSIMPAGAPSDTTNENEPTANAIPSSLANNKNKSVTFQPRLDPATTPPPPKKLYIGGWISSAGVVGTQLAAASLTTVAQWQTAYSDYPFGGHGQAVQLVYAKNNSLVARFSDGSLWHTNDGRDWQPLSFGGVTQILSTNNNSTLYASVGHNFYRSDDGGYNFTLVYSINKYCLTEPYQYNISSFTVSELNNSIYLWTIANSPVCPAGYMYYNNPQTNIFYEAGAGNQSFANVGEIHLYADPTRAGKILATTDRGLYILESFAYTSPGSMSARVVQPSYGYPAIGYGSDPQQTVTSFGANIWLVDGTSTVHKSNDSGETWSDLPPILAFDPSSGTTLPVSVLRTIAFDPSSGVLWVGSAITSAEAQPDPDLISTSDGGQTWLDQTGNMNNTPGLSSSGPTRVLSILPGVFLADTVAHTLGCSCTMPLTGDPINPANGNFFENFNDLSLASPTGSYVRMDIKRAYNSRDTTAGLFGLGWHSNFDMRILLGAGSVTVINPDGRHDLYLPYATTTNVLTYTAPSRANSSLIKNITTGSYTLTNASQVSYLFDTSGNLTGMTDRNGNTVNFNYDTTTHRLATMNDTYGRVFTFTTVVTGSRVTAITDGRRSVYYEYDPSFSFLQVVTDTRGYAAKYYYDTSGDMISWRDQNGSIVGRNAYDNQRRVVSQTTYTGPEIYTAYYDYTSLNNKTIYTNTRGYTSTYAIDPVSQLPISLTDAQNNQYSMALNANDNPVVVTATNGRLIQTDYNPMGRPTAMTTTVTVDGNTQFISNQTSYNGFNDPLVVTDARNNITTYHYTPAGNADIVTDALGHTTTSGYDSQGRVISTTTYNGLNTAYYYGSLGLPTAITETYSSLVGTNTSPTGVSYQTDYTYTPQGWLASRTDRYDTANKPNPLPVTTYQYDVQGRLLTTTNQLGEIATNQYDKIGNLVATTNSLGQQTLMGYDWLKRGISTTQVLASGNLTGYNAYDPANNLRSSTDPRGTVTTYGFDSLNRTITTSTGLQNGSVVASVNTYDPSGNVSTTTQLNGLGSGNQVMRYQYDELNRVVTTTMGYGVLDYQQINLYDKNGNVVESRRSKAAGSSVTNWSDPAQVITSGTTYDQLDRPITAVINAWTATTGNQLLTSNYGYNDIQNQQTITNPYGIVSIAQSDAVGQAISNTLIPAMPTVGAQPETSYSYYDARGLNIRQIDPVGNWQDQGYDLLGRAISSTDYTSPNGGGTALTSRTYYTDTIRPQMTMVGPAPFYQRQDVFRDEANRTLTTTTYTGNGSSNLTVIPSGPLSTRYAYDPKGNLKVMTNSKGVTTTYSYENTDWLKTVSQAVTSAGVSQTLLTTYTYDQVGNQLQTTDANGHTQLNTRHFDVLNRMIDEGDALGNTWRTYYDGLGRVTGKQDGKNQFTGYAYDNASRLLSITNAGTLTTTFAYNAGGQPLTMRDEIGAAAPFTTAYRYDGLNRPLGVTNTQGVVGYSYDLLNRRTALNFGPTTQPNQQTVGYGYDGLSRPLAITATGYLTAPQTLNYSYSGPRLQTMLYPNGVNANYSFDGAGRLGVISQTKTTNNIYTAALSLDPVGNRTSVSEVVSNTSRQLKYGYDEQSRLVQEIAPLVNAGPTVTTTYLYDRAGNRLGKSDTTGQVLTYTLNSGDQLTQTQQLTAQVISGTSTKLVYTTNNSYDNNANLITATQTSNDNCNNPPPTGTTLTKNCVVTTNYTYDTRNRLVGWTQHTDYIYYYFTLDTCNQLSGPQSHRAEGETNPSPSLHPLVIGTTCSVPGSSDHAASFSYDGLNTRIAQTYDGSTTTYLQDTVGVGGLPVVLQEQNSTTNTKTNYLYPQGTTSPVLVSQGTVGRWYHADAIGSVRAMTDWQSGQTVASYNYTAFGDDAGSSGSAGLYNTHGYAGEQHDATGLSYNRARYYNSGVGRFEARDSYPSQNRYTYAGNNPVRYIDPSGYDSTSTLERPIQVDPVKVEPPSSVEAPVKVAPPAAPVETPVELPPAATPAKPMIPRPGAPGWVKWVIQVGIDAAFMCVSNPLMCVPVIIAGVVVGVAVACIFRQQIGAFFHHDPCWFWPADKSLDGCTGTVIGSTGGSGSGGKGGVGVTPPPPAATGGPVPVATTGPTSSTGLVWPDALPDDSYPNSTVSMSDGLSLANDFLLGDYDYFGATPQGNYQFRRTLPNKVGQPETRIARFDINPKSRHVIEFGEQHLNLERHVPRPHSNKSDKPNDAHIPIDPTTIFPKDDYQR